MHEAIIVRIVQDEFGLDFEMLIIEEENAEPDLLSEHGFAWRFSCHEEWPGAVVLHRQKKTQNMSNR